MVPDQESELFDRGWKKVKFVWVCMLMSTLFYLIVAILTESAVNVPMDKSSFDTLRNIAYSMSFITLIATKFIKNRMLSDNNLNTRPVQQQPDDPQDSAISRYMIVMVVSLVLSGNMAISGLFLFFIGKNRLDLYIPIFISAAAMIYYRPQKEEAISLKGSK